MDPSRSLMPHSDNSSSSPSPPRRRQHPEDLERPTLFVVANSHLDTQWRWTIQETIRTFLPRTLRQNFARFEKFPQYILSFEGAFRYMLAQEYFPQDWERLREFVAQSRWAPAGSMLESPDVNIPSPESLLRQILYGNGFFEQHFGEGSCDLFLPDGFGFSYAIPTIAAHCGLLGFSSQKFIKWVAPATIPFDLGMWVGPDGSEILAALNPEGYGDGLREDLSCSSSWADRIEHQRLTSGLALGYKYFGLGDRGGAPDEETLTWLARSLEPGEDLRVVHTRSDELFARLTEEQKSRLPRFRGELQLPTHGTGCWTSQARLKRWNRRNEQLADAAERAAVMATCLQTLPNPRSELSAGWLRFLWHQAHDDLTGTSIPAAYDFTFNDQIVSLNRFATVLTDCVEALAGQMDTDTQGIPALVFNPLVHAREEVVEVAVEGNGEPAGFVRVLDPQGRKTPAQVVERTESQVTVAFLARTPPLSLSVFEIFSGETREQQAPTSHQDTRPPQATEFGLENHRYRVEINRDGDISSIFDHHLGRKLLSGPIRFDLLADRSTKWPAWELRYDDVRAAPIRTRWKDVSTRILENGPARATLEVRRRAGRSTYVQRLSLSAKSAIGAGRSGERLEMDTQIDWHTRGRLLKLVFPLAAANAEATYDLGCGTLPRSNNTRRKYEVPAQRWADLTDAGGEHGVSILNDSRTGWDKPDDRTLRLSLLRSPGCLRRYPHQAIQDFGLHRTRVALFGHPGDWRDGGTLPHAAGLNQPLRAFGVAQSPGSLGRRWSLLEIQSNQIEVRALKLAESGDGLILRLQESHGRSADQVELRTALPIGRAQESNGMERQGAKLNPVDDGRRLRLDFKPYQLRTLRLELSPPDTAADPPQNVPIQLPFNLEATSLHGAPRTGDFDGRGNTLPGELLTPEVLSGPVRFQLGPISPGALNALICRGQSLDLSEGSGDQLFLLAATIGGTVGARFGASDWTTRLAIRGYADRLAPRANRTRLRLLPPKISKLSPQRADIAWLGTHRHDPQGNDEPYLFCYLFRYSLGLPPGARQITLPNDYRIRILAVTRSATKPLLKHPLPDLLD